MVWLAGDQLDRVHNHGAVPGKRHRHALGGEQGSFRASQ